MKKKVLIFPAGTEIAFEIVNALKYSKFVELYGGTSASDHSEFVYKNLIKGFPYVDDTNFVPFLNMVIDKYSIDCVYPAHDSVSVVLSENMDKIHAQVIITDRKTTDICRSKEETYKYLSQYDFIPEMYNTIEDVSNYPVFVKPKIGQGSNGARLVQTRKDLENIVSKEKNLVICEYLPGMEYTIDCFTNGNGALLVSKLRNRERIRNGIAVRSSQIKTPESIKRIAEIINHNFKFIGAWFFQVKENVNGEYKLLEISPRIPGTMGLSRNTGINFPMLTLFVFWGYDVGIIDNGYNITLDRAFYSAYRVNINYEHIYIDFDDTITMNGRVNPDVMRFIYQEKNRDKKIHLLSKHTSDLIEDLSRLHIDFGLFCEIKVLEADEEKYNFITEKNSIFIDDSFAERKKIHDKLDIPVFDVDMIESLMDWRS